MKTSTKTTVRTVLQLVVGLAAALPLLLEASGVPESLPGVGVALAVAGAVTRVMALPRVQQVLDRVGLGTGPELAAEVAPDVLRRLRDGDGSGGEAG